MGAAGRPVALSNENSSLSLIRSPSAVGGRKAHLGVAFADAANVFPGIRADFVMLVVRLASVKTVNKQPISKILMVVFFVSKWVEIETTICLVG